jgi:hypothetical protein
MAFWRIRTEEPPAFEKNSQFALGARSSFWCGFTLRSLRTFVIYCLILMFRLLWRQDAIGLAMLFHRPPKYKYLLVSETSERLTFDAPDDQVAFICGVLIGNAIAICYRIDGPWYEGPYPNRIVSYFERPYSPGEFAWQFLRVDPDWYKKVHRAEIELALQSVVFERPLGGQMLDRYLNILPWPFARKIL